MMQTLNKLLHVVECQVFELCGPFEEQSSVCYYVPYMMNDAVENYLVLKDCRLVGEFLEDSKLPQDAQVAEHEDGYVIAVRQGSENAFTLYFKEIEERIQFYRYHEIGHFWVEGEEQWRQLVYITGTMHDKFSFLGETACNELEKRLLHLIEFGPFLHWSPVHSSLEEDYPESEEGLCTMEYYAKKAGDTLYLKWIRWYRSFPWLRKKLAGLLLDVKREALYQTIYADVKKASQQYPDRVYTRELQELVNRTREQVDLDLKKQGYDGLYPDYVKENRKIHVTEEHPFTILEWNHYKFRVRFMVSECEKSSENQFNSGFFHGQGRKGWIENYDYKY